MTRIRTCIFIHLLILWASLSGCSMLINSSTDRLAQNLSRSMLNQQDPDLVKAGIPSYLLLLDAMISDTPNNENLLRSAAMLNSAYASLFVAQAERQQILADKALNYAARSVCLRNSTACEILTMPYEQFEPLIGSIAVDDVPAFYTLASTWAAWVQAYSDDWNAVSQLARIEFVMKRIVALDETYQFGGAHVYLGIIATLVPPAMGGHPDVGRAHFERSIELSEGKNLMAKVSYAERYARLVFDRDLHDRLLHEALQSTTEYKGLTLMNTIAKQKALQLLASSNEYFL